MLKKVLWSVAILAAAGCLAAPPSFAKATMKHGKGSGKAAELRMTLRDLWGTHIFWVRNVVVATIAGNSDAAKAAEENAVQNAKDIAGAVGSVYGKEAGDKFFPLLAGHYGAVKEYLNADIAGNKEAKDAAVGNLGKNAEEIATFLSSANPNWPKATLVELLMAHGGHHIAQIDQLLAKDYASEAKTWGAMSKHMNVIADALASGIVKQFPKKF
jgi:hypothetical protein